MELKATTLGKRLAQHPYDRAVILNAGIKVSGDRHEYLIPFNQLLAIHCKRGLVWGELEFVLPLNQEEKDWISQGLKNSKMEKVDMSQYR